MTTVINYPTSCITSPTKSYQNYRRLGQPNATPTKIQKANFIESKSSNSLAYNSEIEAEICQRFVRLSCEKMLASKNSQSGARLHRSLLILRLLRKARNSTNILSYECATLLKAHQQSTKPYSDKLERTKTQRETASNTSSSTSKHDKAVLVESIKNKTHLLYKQKSSNESIDKTSVLKNSSIQLTKEANKCNNKRVNIDSTNKDINNNLSVKKNVLLPSVISLQQQQSLTTTTTTNTFNFSTIKQQKNKNEQSILNAIELTAALKNEKNNNSSMKNQHNYVLYNNCKTEPSAFSSQSSTAQKKKNECDNSSMNKALLSNKNRHFNGRLYERIGNSKQDFTNSDKHNETEINSSKFAYNNNKTINKNESKLDSNFYSNYILFKQQQLEEQQQRLQLQLQQKQKKLLTTKHSLCSNDKTLKLQMIMTNPVSPPLNVKYNDLFSKFPNYFNIINLNDSFEKNNIIKNSCENEVEFCQCKEHRFLALNDEYFINNSYEFDSNIHSEKCRKRKTSGRTDISEKRYCCEDDENNLALTDCLEKKTSDWSKDSSEKDENNNKDYEKLNNNNNNNKCANEESTKKEMKTQKLNIEELFVQQYHRNYHHFVTNFGYYQQSFKQAKLNDSNGEQIVPMARQNHFVGPIVGLVAEMPRILMF